MLFGPPSITPFYEILVALKEFGIDIVLILHMNILLMFGIYDDDFVHMIYSDVRLCLTVGSGTAIRNTRLTLATSVL